MTASYDQKWTELPADVWQAVTSFCGTGELVRFRTCSSSQSAARALSHALYKVSSLNLSHCPVLDTKALAGIFARCPNAEAVIGVHCGRLLEAQQDVLPAVPSSCRRLGLRLCDSWPSVHAASTFISGAADWLLGLEQLEVAWNPTTQVGEHTIDEMVMAAAQAVVRSWNLQSLQSLHLLRAPSALASGILLNALHRSAQLRVVQLADVQLPRAGSPFWRTLEEFTYRCEHGHGAVIDDTLLELLAAAAPPLKVLRLQVQSRFVAGGDLLEHGLVTAQGLALLKPILRSLQDLRFSSLVGAFCLETDIELLMLLSNGLGPDLRRLDLEGFPKMGDASLLEMMRGCRQDEGGRGVEALRLLNTAVSDAAFANGLCDSLAPSLKEVRLSGNPDITDGSIQCIAEGGRCVGLERLALGGGGFSDAGLVAMISGARGLRALFLNECDITDDGLLRLAEECPCLRDLGISSCHALTAIGLAALERIPLASLRLDGCPRITSLAVAALLDVLGQHLISLSLEYCEKLNNGAFRALSEGVCWPRLQHLRLIGVKISGVVLRWCTAEVLPSLQRLDLWRDHLPKCLQDAKVQFRRDRPDVTLGQRGHCTRGWSNW
mmetsp:Transcript_15821/g.28830  ORF Transcript_15821/g.28830 Transcript_15821/m.28830 type:complete len:607 (+) Transcript_15821:46-1866(+)